MRPRIAIVDYGVGNLFSARQACERSGFDAVITSSASDVLSADSVLLPGMGAFGNAMQALRDLRLVTTLQKVAGRGTPLIGICLGMQLLMTESEEFGRHEGLGLVPGRVVRFESPTSPSGQVFKVPHVGWNRIHAASHADGQRWTGTPLEGITDGEYMYFVHSYRVQPEDSSVVLSLSRYGHIEFCSTLRSANVFGCQYHPERSSGSGLRIYRNLCGMMAAIDHLSESAGEF